MARPLVPIAIVAGLALALAAGFGINQVRTQREETARVRALTGGDPAAGRVAVERRSCGSCHMITGLPDADGRVGPPLDHFGGRVFIAGRISNTPDMLIQWIEDPHTIDPQSAMPPMGIGEREARDIAAYLYTLK